MHSLAQYVLEIWYVPGIMQGAGNVRVSNMDMVSIHTELEQILAVELHHKRMYLI